jgi:hypothetical protein
MEEPRGTRQGGSSCGAVLALVFRFAHRQTGARRFSFCMALGILHQGLGIPQHASVEIDTMELSYMHETICVALLALRISFGQHRAYR